MEPAEGGDGRDRVALRRCLTPGCRTCEPSAALHLILYRPDAAAAECRSLPLPPRADPRACTVALEDFERRRPGALLHYELCVSGLGVVRATRDGWLARLPGRRNFSPARGG